MPHVLDAVHPGLTTSQSPFIRAAQRDGQLYIHQPYDYYSAENHHTWPSLYARMLPKWERYANAAFLSGLGSLSLPAERVPKLEEVNRFLSPLTGFRARPVSGYIPAFLFFNSLRNREF